MFNKGAPLTNSHNTRSSTLTFHIPHAAPLHGFAGYFESHLYGNIGLSIHPDNSHRVSPDMFSWFPLFFPLKEPLYLPSGSELEVNIWRLWDGGRQRVWYEWSAEAYLPMTPGTGLERRTSANGLTPQLGRGVSQIGGAPSPMMDAPFSPGLSSASGVGILGGGGTGLGNSGQGGDGRVKIGQTSLHNPGGRHSWVGL